MTYWHKLNSAYYNDRMYIIFKCILNMFQNLNLANSTKIVLKLFQKE